MSVLPYLNCQALDRLPSVCVFAQHNPGWLVLDIISSPSLYCAWQVGYPSLYYGIYPYISPGR